jgi:DNA-binding MarR family transcriptional regulator
MEATDAPTHASSTDVAAEVIRLMQTMMKGTGSRLVGALNEHDLSLTQMKALNLLEDPADGASSIKELGARLALSLPAASRTADSLLQRGLVTRTEDPEDRRIKRLALTDKGRDVLNNLEAARLAGVAGWADSLTPTQRDGLHAALIALHHPDPKGPIHA